MGALAKCLLSSLASWEGAGEKSVWGVAFGMCVGNENAAVHSWWVSRLRAEGAQHWQSGDWLVGPPVSDCPSLCSSQCDCREVTGLVTHSYGVTRGSKGGHVMLCPTGHSHSPDFSPPWCSALKPLIFIRELEKSGVG